MRIGTRLGGSFGMILVIMVVMGIFTVTRLALINAKVGVVTEEKWPKTVFLNEISENISLNAMTLRNAALLDNAADIKAELAQIGDRTKATAANFEKLEKGISSGDEKKLYNDLSEQRNSYKKIQKELIALLVGDDKKSARDLMFGSYKDAQNNYKKAIKTLIEFEGDSLVKAGVEVGKTYKSTRVMCITLLCLSLILGSYFAGKVTRSITKPIAELGNVNASLADGDLTVTLNLTGIDEIGQLADSSRRVISSMRDLLGKVVETSNIVASASRQLQSTAHRIVVGTEAVAVQTGTIAAASEEMAITSADIARNCGTAAESSKNTSTSAINGGAIVQETISGMVRIAERVNQSAKTVENLGARSEQIGEIVGTIEDIADQTNLLALNAAIEAARAGEQGRGFAVVADEVRALAERTTRATKEIAEMIRAIQSETRDAVRAMEEGVSEVDRGVASSEKSGEALREILAQINEVTTQIHQIAAAAEEQTATTGAIRSNIHNVTTVVTETAHGAGETDEAANQLATSALRMQKLVSQFKLA